MKQLFDMQDIKSQTMENQIEMEQNNLNFRDDNTKVVNINDIEYNSDNFYKQEDIDTLTDSIRKFGLLHNIVVCKNNNGKYVLISGERRVRAAKQAGRKGVPAKIVNNVNDIAQKIMLIEANNQARKLSTNEKKEEAKRLKELTEQWKKIDKSITLEKVAKKSGISKRQLHRNLNLEKLVPELTKCVSDGIIAESSVIAFAKYDNEVQRQLAETIMNNYKENQNKITRDKANEIKKDMEKQLSEYKNKINKTNKLNDQLQNKNNKLKDEMKKHMSSSNRLKTQMDKKEGEIEELKKQLEEEKIKSTPDKSKVNTIKEQLQKEKEEINNLQKDISQKDNEINKLRKMLEDKQVIKEKEVIQNAVLTTNIKSLINSIENMQIDKYDISKENKELLKQLIKKAGL